MDVLRRTGARVDIAEHATTVTGTGPLRGGFTVDMGDISDTFMTLAAIAPLADAPVTVRGIAHARLKESDRIEAVAENLRGAGHHRRGPGPPAGSPAPRPGDRLPATTASRCPSPCSACGPPASPSSDPGCVAKTFPGFFDLWRRLEQSGAAEDTTG